MRDFPRVVYSEEIDPAGLLAVPITEYLVFRMISIRQVPPTQRIELRDQAERRSFFPLPKQMGPVSMCDQVIVLAAAHERAGRLENAIGTLQLARQHFSSLIDGERLRFIDSEIGRLSATRG